MIAEVRRRDIASALRRVNPVRSTRIVLAVLVLLAATVVGRYPSLMLLAVVGAACLVLPLLREPRWAIVAVPVAAIMIPFNLKTGTDVTLNAAVVAVPLVAALWLASRLAGRSLRFVPTRLNRPLLIFLSISALALVVGNTTWDPVVPKPVNLLLVQLGQISIYLLSFIAFWLTANGIADVRWLRRLAYGAIAGLSFYLVSLLIGSQSGIVLPWQGSSANNLVVTWVTALSSALAMSDSSLRRSQRRLLWGAAGLAVLTAVVINWGWLGGWVPSVGALGLVVWLKIRRIRISLAVAAAIFIAIAGLGPVLEALNWQTEWEVSVGGRATLWRTTLELGSRNPLLGLGPAAYRHYGFMKPLALGGAYWVRPSISAHNQFIDLYAQVGILGLGCYVWFLVEALRLAHRLYRTSTGFIQGYALAALAALMGTILADFWAETSLPFVYNMGFGGFRGSAVAWLLLGGLAVLEQAELTAGHSE